MVLQSGVALGNISGGMCSQYVPAPPKPIPGQISVLFRRKRRGSGAMGSELLSGKLGSLELRPGAENLTRGTLRGVTEV